MISEAWESKTKTLRDIVVYHKRGETVLFTYLKKPACTFDRTYCKENFMKQEKDPHFDKFEDLIAYFNNVFKITVDKDDWKNSTIYWVLESDYEDTIRVFGLNFEAKI